MDKVFLRQHYIVRYRSARRVRWSSEARPSYEAVFLMNGELRWQGADGRGELEPAGVLLINPGEELSLSGAQAAYLALTLSPSFVLDCAVRAHLTRQDAHIVFRRHIKTLDARFVRLTKDLVDELLEEDVGHTVVIDALVEQMMIQLLRRYAGARRADQLELSRVGLVDRRIRRAVELMHAQLERELPLEEIAAAAYLSPFHFARLFKKTTGMSPHAYLAALRTAQAQVLLAQTDLSVTEISQRVGYGSPSHFTKAFRQATGLTPRHFRQALIKSKV